MTESTPRKILHVDMDAFFSSVEQRDDPRLKGLPLVVGGTGPRSVVAAASYEARAFGIRSAMPMVTALRRCPDLVVVRPRFDVYRAVSAITREVFDEHSDLVEPVSIDEAYLDVTVNKKGLPTATAVAESVRAAILSRTGLTASAGVSSNKFLAKMGSGMNKPDGMTLIRPERAADIVAALEVSRFHGIGPATAAKMNDLGIRTGADLRRQSEEYLTARFGKAGSYYRSIAWGIDERPVVPDRERKSYGCETTFESDVSDMEDLKASLAEIADRVWDHRERIRRDGRTVTLKAKYRDFEQITRSRTVKGLVSERAEILDLANDLLASIVPLSKPLRLIGLSVSNLAEVGEVDPGRSQMALF